MRGVWRQVKKEKPPFLPNRSQFFHLMIAMNRCIIQHHKGILTHLKGERIKKFDNFIRSNTVGCRKTFVIIFAVNHTKYIHSCTVSRCNVYILTFENIKDERIDRCKKHNLVDILMIVFMGVLCGYKRSKDKV